MDINDYKMIAHRGLHGKDIPENSCLAFSKAKENKYAIELDVRLTSDKKIVVFHDDNLFRMTGENKEVKKCTLEEIKKLRLGKSNEKIPTLEEVLDLVNGEVPLLIEIKNDSIDLCLENLVIKELEKYNGKYLIESFNPVSVLYVKKKRKNTDVGLLITGNDDFFEKVYKRILFSFITPEFVAYDIRNLDEKKYRYFHEKNMYVIAWTIKEENQKEKAANCSDGIIFEEVFFKD